MAEDEMKTYKLSDSALIYLETIDYPEKLPEKDFAKYMLLLTRAHYRHKVTIENDTLISVAIEYYKRSSDIRNLSESYLCAGRISEVRGNQEEATEFFSDALKLAISSGNQKQAGRSAYGLGELYMDKADYREAKKMVEPGFVQFSGKWKLFP